MADDDDRVGNVRKRIDRRPGALCVGRAGFVERQIRSKRLVTAAAQALDERRPARAVVPLAVDEAERDHLDRRRAAAQPLGASASAVVAAVACPARVAPPSA